MKQLTTNSDLRTAQAHEELLGTLLLYPSLYNEYESELNAEMFYGYSFVYELMKTVNNEEGLTFKGMIARAPIDQVKVLQALKNCAIGMSRIEELVKQAKKDLLKDQLKGIANRLQTDEDPDELLRGLQQHVNGLDTTEIQAVNPKRDAERFVAMMKRIKDDPSQAYGLLTGVGEIDALTMGFQRKDFSVVGARTSMGKSAFTLQVALWLHARGYKVAIFSLEMSKSQIYLRMMSSIMSVGMKDLRTGNVHPSAYDRLEREMKEVEDIYIDDSRGVTSDYIADAMKKLKRSQGLDFVIVDYIQDVAERGEQNDNAGSAIGRICRKLRMAAKDCDCHVMGLSQVTRAAEASNDKRPSNSDLAGSTGIETSADVIALLYREDYYKPDTDKKGILEVNFTKQRNGETGKVELHYDRYTQRISSIR